MKTAVCYLTHRKNTKEMERRWSLLPKDTDNYIISDIKNELKYSPEVKTFTFDFNPPFLSNIELRRHTKEEPIFRYTYIALLYFYEKYPNYDYYWLLEDDILFNGDFSLFFNDTKELKQDIIIASGHFKHQGEHYYWYNDEVNRIYGDFKFQFPLAGGFTGILRWSNSFVKLMYDYTFNKQVYGNAETFPTTVAYLNKIQIGFLEHIFAQNGYFINKLCNTGSRFLIDDLKKLPKNTLIHGVKF